MKVFLINVLLVLSLFAQSSNEEVIDNKFPHYVETQNQFMNGNYTEIIRFDALYFSGNLLDDESKKALDEIIEKIQDYNEKNKNMKVTVIGHSSEKTDDYNELVIDSDSYANAIQNWFRFSQDVNETLENSKDFAVTTSEYLTKHDISESIIMTEYRGSIDKGFTVATSNGRDLSNRVMVTIYVYGNRK